MVQRRRAGGYGWTNRATEDDVFYARRIYCYTQRAGVCARIKRGARRRERREAKVAIRIELAQR
jgi:hypothetical protein